MRSRKPYIALIGKSGYIWLLSIITIVLLIVSCGNGFYFNQKYKYKRNSRCQLALMPIMTEVGFFMDPLWKGTFEKGLPEDYKFLAPNVIRDRLNRDESITVTVKKIIKYFYSHPNNGKSDLHIAITEDELLALRSSLDWADVMLIPIWYSMQGSRGEPAFGVESSTKVEAWIRLYDLELGTLIYERKISQSMDKHQSDYFAAGDPEGFFEKYVVQIANNDFINYYFSPQYWMSTKSLFLSQAYKPAARERYRVAIVPTPDVYSSRLAQTLSDKIAAGRGEQYPIPQDTINALLRDSDDLRSMLMDIINTKYSALDAEREPSISDVLTDDEIIIMKRLISGPDLLLLPTEFFIKKDGSNYYGSAGYRIYDMESGHLLYENYHRSKIAGKEMQAAVADSLASAFYWDYTLYLLNNLPQR
jgi:hypothetical protein